ncbi:MAG: pre-peptidase C-terminal domain-containing protein [Myxococcota bacterium]
MRWVVVGLCSVLAAISGSSCAPEGNGSPTLAPFAPRRAVVDVPVTVPLSAVDPEGDALSFEVTVDGGSASPDRVEILASADGARLQWTPLLSDVGEHVWRVVVTDGLGRSEQPLRISVTAEDGGFGAPVFVQPLGTGATLDLREATCLDVPLRAEDTDSPRVTLGEATGLEGGTTVQEGDRDARWSFCPTKDQVAGPSRVSATFSADDGDNPPTLKPYLILLRRDDGADCPGAAPEIIHVPEDATGSGALTVVAEVRDDQGIKFEPLFYYSTTDPGPDPDLGAMTQVTMVQLAGDDRDGTWGADVPNPVAGAAPGSTADLFYVFLAEDDDDTEGTCDHTTESPVYRMTVDNPEGAGKDLCEPCTSESECGDGPEDLCLALGGSLRCFTGCMADTDCPTDYYCSFGALSGVDGTTGRQCIPDTFTCLPPPPVCMDDAWEDNDTLATAAALGPGQHSGLVSCPQAGGGTGDDEDWYLLTLTASSQLQVTLQGGAASDLDLALYDANGNALDTSSSLSSNESVSTCGPAGSYYARVHAFGAADNPYQLDVVTTADDCGVTPTCTDDTNEDDDDPTSARAVPLPGPYQSTTQAICSLDDDWYEVFLFAGETIYADLTFSQNLPSEDLDLYIYDDQGNNLTGCSETTPAGCDPNNGQSVTSDESAAWSILQTGTFFIVVRGWNGAENLYDICLGLTPTACP